MASTSESLSTAVKLLREKASDTRDAWVQDGIEEREAVLAAERVVDRFTEQLYSSDASVIDLGDDFWDSIAMEFRKAKPLGVVLRRMIEQELSSSGASIVAFATSDQVIWPIKRLWCWNVQNTLHQIVYLCVSEEITALAANLAESRRTESPEHLMIRMIDRAGTFDAVSASTESNALLVEPILGDICVTGYAAFFELSGDKNFEHWRR